MKEIAPPPSLSYQTLKKRQQDDIVDTMVEVQVEIKSDFSSLFWLAPLLRQGVDRWDISVFTKHRFILSMFMLLAE